MQSLDSSTEWSSHESLSSTPSFAYSESDHTEDEGDIFSEGEGEGGRASLECFSLAAASQPAHLCPIGYRREQPERGPLAEEQQGGAGQRGQPPSSATVPPTEGDVAYARKCSELQGYLRPLLELLNGLKTGRFEKGLNTFQQSVAMDRLQRIVGVLQKPHLGEKYLRTLHQIEMMLKMWFPQVRLHHSSPLARHSTTPSPSHWHRDQLHIPVKKRRRSWSDSDSSSSMPPMCKRTDNPGYGDCSRPAEETPQKEEESVTSKHDADLCSSKVLPSHEGKHRGPMLPLIIAPLSVGSNTDTQDSFISSTTPTSHGAPNTPLQSELLPPGSSSQSDAIRGGEVGVAKVEATGEQNQYSKEAGLTNNSHRSLCNSQNT